MGEVTKAVMGGKVKKKQNKEEAVAITGYALPMTLEKGRIYGQILAQIEAIELDLDKNFLQLGKNWKIIRDEELWRAAGSHLASFKQYCHSIVKRSYAHVHTFITVYEKFAVEIDNLPSGHPSIAYSRLVKVLPLLNASKRKEQENKKAEKQAKKYDSKKWKKNWKEEALANPADIGSSWDNGNQEGHAESRCCNGKDNDSGMEIMRAPLFTEDPKKWLDIAINANYDVFETQLKNAKERQNPSKAKVQCGHKGDALEVWTHCPKCKEWKKIKECITH